MCIITTHAIFISSPKQNIMNTDSKLKRFVILLGRAPYILFIESADPIDVNPLLRSIGLSDVVTTVPLEIHEQTHLLTVFTLIDKKLPDPIAHKAIDALTSAIMGESPTGLFSIRQSSVAPYIVSNEWQRNVKWQNVDSAPEPTNYFTIVVSKFIHELSINTMSDEENCDGVIHIESLDPSVPFPQALLKECVIEIHDIIIQMSANRITADKTKSKYLSVTQTGHDSFNYINLRQIEKDLKDTLATFNIAVENRSFT